MKRCTVVKDHSFGTTVYCGEKATAVVVEKTNKEQFPICRDHHMESFVKGCDLPDWEIQSL